MRRLLPALALTGLLGAAGAGAATAGPPIRSALLSTKRHPGRIVVRRERVTIGTRTSIVTTVTMPRPGRRHALEPYLPSDRVSEGTATTTEVSRALGRYGTAVAVNADLFEYASGQPSGLLMIEGQIYNQPQGNRPALSVDVDGTVSVSRPRSVGTLTLPGGRTLRFEDNVRRDNGIVAYDEGWGPKAPEHARHSVVAQVIDGELFQRSNGWVARARLRAIRSRPGALRIPPDEAPQILFSGYGRQAARLAAARRGRTFELRYRLAPLPGRARFAVGGGPILVRDGKLIYRRASNREFSDGQLVPPDARTAVAQLRDGRVVFYAVEDTHGSDGFTVGEVARDLHRRGAKTAMAFDSGGSTAISLNGRLLTDPKDGVERPVGNMLVFFRPDKGGRPLGAVHIGRRERGEHVPPLSFTLLHRAKVTVTLTEPKGRLHVVMDGPLAVGTHRIEPPATMRSGRWELEVTTRPRDRVVKPFAVARDAVVKRELAPARTDERRPVSRTGPLVASPADDGSALPWIAGGAALVAAVGAVAAVALRRRRV